MEGQGKREFVDILKGIAIFAMVVGHLEPDVFHISNISDFHNIFLVYVYSFHLALFFFVSGFLYKKEKYQDSPSLNFINRFKRCCIPLITYCILTEIIIYLIPSLLYKLIYHQDTAYDIANFPYRLVEFATLISVPYPLWGTWFIGPLIISSTIFGIIIYFSKKIQNKILQNNPQLIKKASTYQNIFIIFSSIAMSLIGYYEISNKIMLAHRAETGLFVVPLLTLGYYTNTLIKNLNKFLNPFVAICTLFLTVYLAYFYFPAHNFYLRQALSHQWIYYSQFYILSILGIYQIMFIAKFLLSYRYAKFFKKFFSFIGKYSFEIMIFHWLVFLSIDFILSSHISAKIDNVFFKYALIFTYVTLACLIPAIIKNKISIMFKQKSSNPSYITAKKHTFPIFKKSI